MWETIIVLVFAGLFFYFKRAWNDNMDIARVIVRPLVQEEISDKSGKVRDREHFFRRIAVAQVRTVDMAQRMTVQNFVHVVFLIFLLVFLPLASVILWLFFLITLMRCFLVWVAGNHKRRVQGIYSRLSLKDQAEVEQLRHLEGVRFRLKK